MRIKNRRGDSGIQMVALAAFILILCWMAWDWLKNDCDRRCGVSGWTSHLVSNKYGDSCMCRASNGDIKLPTAQ